ncbi:MAG TPA: formylmethanofuran dehydrogenase subunit C [Gemmatimonadaceae bacterium]|nr:formylmethanofuran dehydrogenase subunit C [Gemmatimonadaceae bacterium]
MSDHVTLTLRAVLGEPLDLEGILPERLAMLGERDITALPVWSGRVTRALGDYFDVRGERSASLRIEGDVRRCRNIGAAMTGGAVEISGDAGDDLGVSMSGGSIRVRGNAGDRVGSGAPGASRGMTGGEIVVDGAVGSDAGARMRRGLLFVGGDTGSSAARAIIAGTVIVMGRVGAEPATASKRGTLVAGGEVEVPLTYRYACRYQPPHVRLALTYLARRHGAAVDAHAIDAHYDRYCGDAGTVAKGEILIRVRQ